MFGCNRPEIKSAKVTVEATVYNDPDGDLYDSFILPISTMYFYEGHCIEELPEALDSTLSSGTFGAYIYDQKFAPLSRLEDIEMVVPDSPISEKKFGALFSQPPVPNYDSREELTDTIFNGRNYKRFKIVSDSDYTVYYLNLTDSIYPYSLAKQFEKDYKGSLDRIDSYDIVNNRFTSLKMAVSDTIPSRYYSSLQSKSNEK